MPGHLRLRIVALALGLAVLASPITVSASSHSEAPGTAKDRLADDTDFYAWVASDAPDAVTFVANWVPLIEPNSGPNFASFDDEASYYINVDNVGDCQDRIRYQFTFETTRQNGNTFLYNTGPVTSLNDPDLNVRQTFTLTRYDNGVPTVLIGDAPVAPYFVGPVSMPNYAALAAAAVQTLPNGTKVFVGPRDDPFWVDLAAVFDLLTIRKPPGNKGKGVDGVAGYNVMSVVLQVPKTALTKDGQAPSADLNNHILGCYASTERPANRTLNPDGTVQVSGSPVQVSRLGHPLVNEVVIALQDKDKFNASKPTADGQFAGYVTNPEVPVLLNLLYGISVPPTPRNDLVAVFLTGIPGLNQPAGGTACELLRLNLTIAPASNPSRFGILAGDLAGFPNGRRLGDDVVDMALRVVAGATPFTPAFNVSPNRDLGDGIDANDRPFLPAFPYVAPPHNPLSYTHTSVQHGNSPNSIGGRGSLGLGDQEEVSAAEAAGASKSATLSFAGANPADRSALQFTLATRARVKLTVYDVQGRAVRQLIDQEAAPGTFRAQWDGRSEDGSVAGKGVYFVRFTTDSGLSDTRKVILE